MKKFNSKNNKWSQITETAKIILLTVSGKSKICVQIFLLTYGSLWLEILVFNSDVVESFWQVIHRFVQATYVLFFPKYMACRNNENQCESRSFPGALEGLTSQKHAYAEAKVSFMHLSRAFDKYPVISYCRYLPITPFQTSSLGKCSWMLRVTQHGHEQGE